MENAHKHTNALAEESSPYLLQHAHNPVNWYPWGEKALSIAKAENKPILVSIGYAACHWCHVMEREAFKDEEVAEIMNKYFVCIKVDREERPDIDKIYMDAVTMMTGHGGWPLNCFALPDGRPFYGGTYFPKERWLSILNQVYSLFSRNNDKAEGYANNLLEAMKGMNKLVKADANTVFSKFELNEMLSLWMEQIDFKHGGRRTHANKFPLPTNNLFLTRAAHLVGDSQVQEAVNITLSRMAFGGIYDHVGGGFARYSVDIYWKVPHFEKMLYDNGQLISTYSEAFIQTGNPVYRQAVNQTLEFIQRELTSPEGGFYSSLDADSEGVEGKFYTWTYDEIHEILGDKAELFADYYNIHPFGNWENTNVLFVLQTEEDYAVKNGLNPQEFSIHLATLRERVLEARADRIRPGLDDKILTSWNGLMLKGYVDAYKAFGKEEYREIAIRNAGFILDKVAVGGRLYRNYKEGKRSINGFLDDYANVIEAFIALYEITFDEQWIQHADRFLSHVKEHFFDKEQEMFFYTSDEDDPLVNRKYEVQDDVIPSANATLANALFDLGLLLDNVEYQKLANQMLSTMKDAVIKAPAWHSKWGLLILKQLFPYYEVVVTGEKADSYRDELFKNYGPNRLYAGGRESGTLPLLEDRFLDETTIFVCEGKACKLPVHTVEAALEQM